MDTTLLGSNTSKTPTTLIQQKLGNGALAVDNDYGPQTTAAVKAFQAANGLKVDGIFGPVTETAFKSKFDTPTIVSTGSIHTDAAKNSATLDTALRNFNANYQSPTAPVNPNTETDPNADTAGVDITDASTDPFIQQLNNMSARSNDSTKMLIQTIQANKVRQANAVNKQYENYKSGLQLLGIQSGDATATPDLVAGHIQEAATEQEQKISDLDTEETKALMDAENARADNDFKVLQDKMDYVKQIKQDKAQALKDYNDALTKSVTDGDKIAQSVAHDVYDTLQTLDDTDKETFLTTLATKFNIPAGSLVTALVDEQSTRTSDAAKADPVLSPTEAATLGVPYGTTQSQAKAKGITPDRYKPTTPSTTDIDKDNVTKTKNILKTGKDENGNPIIGPDGKPFGAQGGTENDGYYDPYLYIKVFNAFNGTPKEFIAKYPIVGSINPKSYNLLPQGLQDLLPKTKTSSGRSASGS